MSNELRSLLARVEGQDPDTAKELRRHIDALQSRRQFGLNFERHTPESVALTGRPISVGDKVQFLPPRGEVDVDSDVTWTVTAISGPRMRRVAQLVDPKSGDEAARSIEDLVFVADFRDPIYPGLKRSDEPVLLGGDKPFHTVINAENYHALEALLFTHQGQVDCIYIDPPYNTGAKDWKYNNDYVDGEDAYRHSKWLAFMERRLKMARKLLNPRDSVLIVTIDEKEYLRLGLLLEQTFPDGRINMVSSVINPSGSQRPLGFWRTDEYIFFVALGSAVPSSWVTDMTKEAGGPAKRRAIWNSLRRRGAGNLRSDRPGCFYPIYVQDDSIVAIGSPLGPHEQPGDEETIVGATAMYPIREDGTQGRYECNPKTAEELRQKGYLRLKMHRGEPSIQYLRRSEIQRLSTGELLSRGRTEQGHLHIEWGDEVARQVKPKSAWNMPSHDADQNGSRINRLLMPDRKFPYPKSLYAVEDSLRFFVGDKPDALVLDFFSGSGTTAHAVMRLNKQDGGRRRSISVTNNEVSADEQKRLVKKQLRPGDPDWEALGICDYITKPRIKAAITGQTPAGDLIKGDYKFVDEFPMADGFEENVEFFTLTYENPALVELDLAFERIAPLLWMRAGSEGRRVDERTDTFEVADTYAVLFNVDSSKAFLAAVEKADGLRIAYIVTDDETQYQAIAGQLPEGIESGRLYESYLRTFQINTGRA